MHFTENIPPQVTAQPINLLKKLSGSTVMFSVTATGTAPLSYQWQKDGVNLNDGGSISGATTATLTITGVTESNEGGYRCVVTNSAGTDTSNTATPKVRDNMCAGCCPKNKGLQSTRHEVTHFRLSLLHFDFQLSNNVKALKERHYSSGSERVTLPCGELSEQQLGNS